MSQLSQQHGAILVLVVQLQALNEVLVAALLLLGLHLRVDGQELLQRQQLLVALLGLADLLDQGQSRVAVQRAQHIAQIEGVDLLRAVGIVDAERELGLCVGGVGWKVGGLSISRLFAGYCAFNDRNHNPIFILTHCRGAHKYVRCVWVCIYATLREQNARSTMETRYTNSRAILNHQHSLFEYAVTNSSTHMSTYVCVCGKPAQSTNTRSENLFINSVSTHTLAAQTHRQTEITVWRTHSNYIFKPPTRWRFFCWEASFLRNRVRTWYTYIYATYTSVKMIMFR